MTAPLALRSSALTPPLQIGAQMALQMSTGGIAASFVLKHYDKSQGVALYSLRVVNGSNAALACRVWGVLRNGESVLAYPIPFQIGRFAIMSTDVPVWTGDYGSLGCVVADVVGESVHFVVQAALPARASGVGRRYITVTSIVLVCFAAALAALSASMPRIVAFAAPPAVMAGTTVRAEYSASGLGKLSYSVTAPDGSHIAGGELADRSGTIAVAIPTSHASDAYVLSLTLRGMLGRAKELRVLNAVVPPARDVARIGDLSVKPIVAKPGQAIDVAYSASADGGYVRLLGSGGTIWAQKPFSRTGMSRLVIPALPGQREMRVLLHVTKGRSFAESNAGVLVATSNTWMHGDARQRDAANGTFEVFGRTVDAGAPIRIRILSPRNGMRISLNDTQSNEIASRNVGSNAEAISLRAPEVTVPTRYTVVASFTDGFGQESIVQPITVRP